MTPAMPGTVCRRSRSVSAYALSSSCVRRSLLIDRPKIGCESASDLLTTGESTSSGNWRVMRAIWSRTSLAAASRFVSSENSTEIWLPPSRLCERSDVMPDDRVDGGFERLGDLRLDDLRRGTRVRRADGQRRRIDRRVLAHGQLNQADDAGDRREQGRGDRQDGTADAELGQRHRRAIAAARASKVDGRPMAQLRQARGHDGVAGVEPGKDLDAARRADSGLHFAPLCEPVDDDVNERRVEIRNQRFRRDEQRLSRLAERELDVRERARQERLAADSGTAREAAACASRRRCAGRRRTPRRRNARRARRS